MKTMTWTAVIVALISGCWEGNGDTQATSRRNQSEPIAKASIPSQDGSGMQIAASCDRCHGDDEVGRTQYIPYLAGQRLEYLVRELEAYREGARDNATMHAVVRSLSDEEARSAATYFAARGVEEGASMGSNPETWPRFVVTPATSKWVPKCNRCHDDNGFADHGRYPILTGQRREYLAGAMHAYQNKFLRDNSTMHAMTELLSAQDIDDIAAYYTLRPGQERVGRPGTKPTESGERPSD